MRAAHLPVLGEVSKLALGGGGLGHLWGPTTREECVATLRAAVDQGVTLIDLAPRYGDGESEEVFGAAFEGKPPAGIKVTSKCLLGDAPVDQIETRLRASVATSLKRLRLERLDLFFLHSNVVPDDGKMRDHPDAAVRMTPYSNFVEHVRPAFERMVADGLIGAWGLTGIGYPPTIMKLLGESPKPAAVQCLANPLDSAGELQFFEGAMQPRDVIRTATENGVGVLGIRAVQGGALAAKVDRDLPADHPVMRDYGLSGEWRALASELGEDPSDLAHRYALSMAGVDVVVLGIKNRAELDMCLAAEARGPLAPDVMARIDACFFGIE
jgi:aryl-alcohol dehydrogenase-like predicted oxidoreductase